MKKIVNGKAVEMTAEEAAAVQAEWDANAAEAERRKPLDAIVAIEQKNPITHRGQREFYLGFGEAFPQFKETHLYKEAKRVDDAIRAERAKL